MYDDDFVYLVKDPKTGKEVFYGAPVKMSASPEEWKKSGLSDVFPATKAFQTVGVDRYKAMGLFNVEGEGSKIRIKPATVQKDLKTREQNIVRQGIIEFFD